MLTRVKQEGFSTGNKSDMSSTYLKRIDCMHFLNSNSSSAKLSLKVSRKLWGVA